MRFARLVIAFALVMLGVGTIAEPAPGWANQTTYAICAFVAAAVWISLTLLPAYAERLEPFAWSALIVLALIRGSGYFVDTITDSQMSYLAPVAAWTIIGVLSILSIRRRQLP